MFNPLIHKKPYGATVVGKENYIEFPLDPDFRVKRVRFILRKDDRSYAYEMSKTQDGVFFLNF